MRVSNFGNHALDGEAGFDLDLRSDGLSVSFSCCVS